MVAYEKGTFDVLGAPKMTDFDIEISYGSTWVSLNDGRNYTVNADDFGNRSQQRRRITATSPYYDGTFLVHSTLENVTEAVNVYVRGASPNEVTENILWLTQLIDQEQYNVRVRMDDHMETWICEPADYSIDRSHVFAHNVMALVKLSITRLPKVTYEVVM